MRSLLFGRNERANVYGLLQKPVEMHFNYIFHSDRTLMWTRRPMQQLFKSHGRANGFNYTPHSHSPITLHRMPPIFENYSNCQWQKVSTAISEWSNCKRYESTALAELKYYQSFELTRSIYWPHKSNCRHTCGGDTEKNYLRFIWGSCGRMVRLMSERVKNVWKIVSPRCLVYSTRFVQHLALQATCEKLQTKINTQSGRKRWKEYFSFFGDAFHFRIYDVNNDKNYFMWATNHIVNTNKRWEAQHSWTVPNWKSERNGETSRQWDMNKISVEFHWGALHCIWHCEAGSYFGRNRK